MDYNGLSTNMVKDFDLQLDSMRQTLASRDETIKKLLGLVQGKDLIPTDVVSNTIEVDRLRTRVIDAEARAMHFQQQCMQRDQDVNSLRSDYMMTNQKMQSLQARLDQFLQTPIDHRDPMQWQSVLDAKDIRIHDLERRCAKFENEIDTLRTESRIFSGAAEFTDKSVSSQEFTQLQLKLEKCDLELSQKATEIQTLQARLQGSEEQLTDYKRRVEETKEATVSKETLTRLQQADIDALRVKLERKNETIEEKAQQIQKLTKERSRLQSDLNSVHEQMKVKDSKIVILERKISSLEDLLRDANQQLEMMRTKVSCAPSVVQQQQFQDQLEQMAREQEKMLGELKGDKDRLEQDRMEDIERHAHDVHSLGRTVEMLEQELADKQVLLESQTLKIEEADQQMKSFKAEAETSAAKLASLTPDAKEREVTKLQGELHQARFECDRLLTLLKNLESDKQKAQRRMREMDDRLRGETSGSGDDDLRPFGASTVDGVARERRIEELEEALRESVSLTAERDVAIAAHKAAAQQAEIKLKEFRDEMEKQKQSGAAGIVMQSDDMARAMHEERLKHLEEVSELKSEALLAAISEKDAHIALLEASRDVNAQHQVEVLRKHKDKLVKKLKEENANRLNLTEQQQKLGVVVSQRTGARGELGGQVDGVASDSGRPGIWT